MFRGGFLILYPKSYPKNRLKNSIIFIWSHMLFLAHQYPIQRIRSTRALHMRPLTK